MEFEGLFKQILVLASNLRVMRLGSVSLDRSEIQSNASKHQAMSWGYPNELEKQPEQEVQQLLELPEHPDGEREAPQTELDIPEELQRREQRPAAIQNAKDKSRGS